MARKTKSNPPATVTEISPSASTAIALPTITERESRAIVRDRAVELYHTARTEQQAKVESFERQYGRADRIDASLLSALNDLQMRFAAIGARQQRYGYGQEPRTNKFVKALGDIIGEVTAHLATERALELFAPIRESDYVGFGGEVGELGRDESVLQGYRIIKKSKTITVTNADDVADDDDDDDEDDHDVDETIEPCPHDELVPLEDNPERAICSACDHEFAVRDDEVAP